MDNILSQFSNKGQGEVLLNLNYLPGIALLTLNNPKRHNALSGKMMVEFYKAIVQLETNTQDLVAVICMSSSKSFCAGLDLSFAREHLSDPNDVMAINKLMYVATEKLSHLPLLTMAIATGGSIGGGSELITAFDFICMSKETGYIHFVQTRMGVSSPWGGMQRLVSTVGKKRALIWMAGGCKVKASEAFKYGVVDLVVEKDEDCLKETISFLQPFLVDENTLQKVSPQAVRGMKKLSIESNWDIVNQVLSSTVFSKL